MSYNTFELVPDAADIPQYFQQPVADVEHDPRFSYNNRQGYQQTNQGQSNNRSDNAGPVYNSNSSFLIPDVVRNFICYFHEMVRTGNIQEINLIYEQTFNQLTERYYKASQWPPPDQVAPLVHNDNMFLTLYKELFYRHIYSKLQPSLEQRFESYENYCDLFSYIINDENGPVDLQLPNQWLWDMVDEFIYQFQAFCQYRSKLKSKSESEIQMLRENQQIWNVHSVLNVLHSLVDKSCINEQLEIFKAGGDASKVAGTCGALPLYKMLGYFSLIGLCRVQCLLGDYHLALQVLKNVELNKKSLYSRVPSCQITTYYYVGFSYLMMRRYQDAVKTFTAVLQYIQRIKQYQSRTYQFEQLLKKNEQMYCLLAIAVTLCPQRIDESVHAVLRDKCSEKIFRMQKGDESCFEELFSFACPKYISPHQNYDVDANNFHTEPFKLQLRIFLNEVRQQVLLPTIRSYMKLYTSIPVEKLGNFLDMTASEFNENLMCFKHKSHNKVWSAGSPLSGASKTCSDVDFYLDKSMIHIADTKVEKRYGEFFIRHVSKFEEIINLSN